MKPALLIVAILAAIVVVDLGWQVIASLASGVIFAIGRAAYEQAAHLLGF